MNTLAGLDSLLDDFYSSHAQVDNVGKWLASHAFDEALPGHAEAPHTFLNALHSIMAELTE